MPREKPVKPSSKRDDPAQSKRFIEAAKELGDNPDPQAFEKAFDALAKSRARKGRD
jgi:hypothetical protein